MSGKDDTEEFIETLKDPNASKFSKGLAGAGLVARIIFLAIALYFLIYVLIGWVSS